jgi:hypothetical protein
MPPASKKAPSSRPAWIYVTETGNDPGPLRVHGKPRVRVKSTGIEPGPILDAWLAKSRGMKKLGATRIRYDLMPPAHEPGGQAMPFRVPEEAAKLKASIKALREKLSAEGYTVNGDMTVWHVYVIELHPPKKTKKTASPAPTGYLYVGQTSIGVLERARQHATGPAYPWKGKPKYSRPCHKRFKALRLDMLPPGFNVTIYSEEEALHAESGLRVCFERQGFEVIGGQEKYPGKSRS